MTDSYLHQARQIALLRAPGRVRYSENTLPPICRCAAFSYPHMERVSKQCCRELDNSAWFAKLRTIMGMSEG